MASRPLHLAQVVENRLLSPHVRLTVLRAASFAAIADTDEGGYMKLLLPKTGPGATAETNLADLDIGAVFKRSFTIARVCGNELTLNIAVHPELRGGSGREQQGPAAAWAASAAEGDFVCVTGPGPVDMLAPELDSYFLAGDMTGLPGISVNLRKLPKAARGLCLIEVLSEEDCRELVAPAGVKVEWIVTCDPSKSKLAERVRESAWPQGRVGVWAASEYSVMKELRDYFRSRQVLEEDLYVSSYWKLNATDEEHKQTRRIEEG